MFCIANLECPPGVCLQQFLYLTYLKFYDAPYSVGYSTDVSIKLYSNQTSFVKQRCAHLEVHNVEPSTFTSKVILDSSVNFHG